MAGIITGEVEVAGVGPNDYPFLVYGQQPSGPINDAATAAQGILFLRLHLAGPGLQTTALHHLQPGEAQGETPQAEAEQHHHGDQPIGRHRMQLQDAVLATAATAGGAPLAGGWGLGWSRRAGGATSQGSVPAGDQVELQGGVQKADGVLG